MSSSFGSILAKVSNKVSEVADKALQKLSGPPTNLNNGENLEPLDNTAFRVNGKWVAEFVISVFERENRAGLEKVVNEVLSHIPGIKGDDIIWERLKYFVSVPVGNVKIVLRQEEGQDVFTVGPTMHNGFLSNEIAFPQEGNTWTQGDQVIFTVLAPPDFPDPRSFTMNFGEEEGVGIISDIDDTIKISDVRDRKKLLWNTFVNPDPQPVPGMPELYSGLNQLLGHPTIIYLSASPWQLYSFLRPFTNKYYPPGQIILRDMSYMELSSFLMSLTVGTQEFKQDEMEKIHRWFPKKKFLCTGDSTQTDPEAYGTMYRKYPGWIKGIWIRIVEGVDPSAEKTLNAPERFEKAFKGVPKNIWRTFKDPSELKDGLL